MALTITAQAEAGAQPSAPTFVDRVQVVFDASYPTGGELFDPTSVIGAGKTLVGVPPVIDIAGAKIVVWDRANGKLQIVGQDLVEVAGASDQSGVDVEVIVLSQ